MNPETNPSAIPPFDILASGYKTYITAGLGIIFNFLQAFGIFTFSDSQTMAINGIVVMGVAIFLRMGVRKAQVSAAVAAQSAQSAEASAQSAETAVINNTPAPTATINRDSLLKP